MPRRVMLAIKGPDVLRSLVRKSPGSAGYFVSTATLVEPRVTPPASLKRTKIRLFAGAKAMTPLPVANIEKVGVALGAMLADAVDAAGERHAPVSGLV